MTSFLALATIYFLLIRVLNPYLIHTHISPIFYQSHMGYAILFLQQSSSSSNVQKLWRSWGAIVAHTSRLFSIFYWHYQKFPDYKFCACSSYSNFLIFNHRYSDILVIVDFFIAILLSPLWPVIWKVSILFETTCVVSKIKNITVWHNNLPWHNWRLSIWAIIWAINNVVKCVFVSIGNCQNLWFLFFSPNCFLEDPFFGDLQNIILIFKRCFGSWFFK